MIEASRIEPFLLLHTQIARSRPRWLKKAASPDSTHSVGLDGAEDDAFAAPANDCYPAVFQVLFLATSETKQKPGFMLNTL